ncbi:response regulator (plasmid) [Devosia neptuniae]|uniref:Response regulator n=1 Tax=Devosia neptuniae TaxID=191302 RepID=A0ABY6C6X7_9HYPH|nr:response regulator [Devosia neptuniae]UXN68002.1 response regulator [Devosia neptuniae]
MTWLAIGDKPARINREPAAINRPVPSPTGTLRILIVEDEFLIALELENRLLDAGFEVVGIAATAEEALSLAASELPDLAITDIRLAGRKDGVDTAIELFTTLRLRSIFSSAHANDTETRNRAAPAYPIGWLQKPYPANVLVRMIRSYLMDG